MLSRLQNENEKKQIKNTKTMTRKMDTKQNINGLFFTFTAPLEYNRSLNFSFSLSRQSSSWKSVTLSDC